jgi:hypothetical protein
MSIQDKRLAYASDNLNRVIAQRDAVLAKLVRLELRVKELRSTVKRKQLRVAATKPTPEESQVGPVTFKFPPIPVPDDLPNDSIPF